MQRVVVDIIYSHDSQSRGNVSSSAKFIATLSEINFVPALTCLRQNLEYCEPGCLLLNVIAFSIDHCKVKIATSSDCLLAAFLFVCVKIDHSRFKLVEQTDKPLPASLSHRMVVFILLSCH